MKTCKEIRHENLLFLINRFDTIQALADKLGKSHAQVSQLKNKSTNSATGKVRGIGDEQAREIELKLGLEVGWLDHQHAPGEITHLNTILGNFPLTTAEEPGRQAYEGFKDEARRSSIDEILSLLNNRNVDELETIRSIISSLDTLLGHKKT